MDVYKSISVVSAIVAQEGIRKSRKHNQQGFMFRGIDDVMNSLARPLADSELVILPRIIGREVVERTAKSGGTLFYVTIEVEFDLYPPRMEASTRLSFLAKQWIAPTRRLIRR